jgi:hypothetical protein
MVDQKSNKCYNMCMVKNVAKKQHQKYRVFAGVDQKYPFCYNNGIVSKKVVAIVPVDTKRALAYNTV